ncbi:MAG TPA: hypothetical protein VIH04_06500 [Nitrosarchaeum sp.]
MSQLKGLDSWLTSGRYQYEYLLVECNHCCENTIVKAEQEFGAVWWEPEECKYCKKDFDDNVTFQSYYPEEEI